jgi:hypothetical protein
MSPVFVIPIPYASLCGLGGRKSTRGGSPRISIIQTPK